MAKCSGDSEIFLCFGYFLNIEAFRSEQLQGINSSYNPIKFCIKKDIFSINDGEEDKSSKHGP